MASNANVFGSFLSTVQDVAEHPAAKQAFDIAAELVKLAADKGQRTGGDVIPAILNSIARASQPATILSIAKETGLGIDQIASSLQDAERTGLLKREASLETVTYDLTTLGKDFLKS